MRAVCVQGGVVGRNRRNMGAFLPFDHIILPPPIPAASSLLLAGGGWTVRKRAAFPNNRIINGAPRRTAALYLVPSERVSRFPPLTDGQQEAKPVSYLNSTKQQAKQPERPHMQTISLHPPLSLNRSLYKGGGGLS